MKRRTRVKSSNVSDRRTCVHWFGSFYWATRLYIIKLYEIKEKLLFELVIRFERSVLRLRDELNWNGRMVHSRVFYCCLLYRLQRIFIAVTMSIIYELNWIPRTLCWLFSLVSIQSHFFIIPEGFFCRLLYYYCYLSAFLLIFYLVYFTLLYASYFLYLHIVHERVTLLQYLVPATGFFQ